VNREPKLHVEAHGEGRPVLFLHGFAGSARNWRGSVRGLSDRARCVAYDARGHARSEAPRETDAYSVDHAIADGWRALDAGAPGSAPALLVGLSMGAAVALQMTLARPERVGGLLLASLPAGAAAGRGPSAHALAFASAIEREGLEAAGARFVWGPDSGLDERGAALVRQGFLEHPAHGLALTLRGVLSALPAPGELPPLPEGLPVQIVAGGEDAPSLAPSHELAGRIPGACLDVVPGAGHVLNLAAPRAFAGLLDRVLNG